MKDTLIKILDEYLSIFPEERTRQAKLFAYLQSQSNKSIVDWNNFDGHVVAGGFIYSKEEHKFLVLYHKDLKLYLYPGGHINIEEQNPLQAAKREIEEETSLKDLEQLTLSKNELIPIDIDTHLIDYNERLGLPEHYHFDFRYLFVINHISKVAIEKEEISNYKWIDIEELKNDSNYGNIVNKIEKLLDKS